MTYDWEKDSTLSVRGAGKTNIYFTKTGGTKTGDRQGITAGQMAWNSVGASTDSSPADTERITYGSMVKFLKCSCGR